MAWNQYKCSPKNDSLETRKITPTLDTTNAIKEKQVYDGPQVFEFIASI